MIAGHSALRGHRRSTRRHRSRLVPPSSPRSVPGASRRTVPPTGRWAGRDRPFVTFRLWTTMTLVWTIW